MKLASYMKLRSADNVEAHRPVGVSFSRLKPKQNRPKKPKKRRLTNWEQQELMDALTMEFAQMVRSWT